MYLLTKTYTKRGYIINLLQLIVDTYICKALLVSQVPKRSDHIRLKVVPFEKELLVAHIG